MTELDFTPKSDFMKIAVDRGFYYQCSDAEGLDAKMAAGPITGYIGFDCTAPSFHIGNLIQIMRLYWLQQTGHNPIALIGGATTKVGDPSGKDKTRPVMTQETLDKNKATLRNTFASFIDFNGGDHPAIMLDNDDWTRDIKYVDFLREIGSKFSVNRLLALETAKMRLEREQEFSFIEFNYTLLQANDFLHLRQNHDCVLQMGGSDQWGNIISGVDLGRRSGHPDMFALTCPLITTADGRKMGKSENGAVWLNEDMLSAFDYWQYWRNVLDADVARFMRLFTTLPLDEIARVEALEGAEMNDGKIMLANAATAMLHGQAAADAAHKAATAVFTGGSHDDGAPSTQMTQAQLADGVKLLDFMAEVGLISSKKEGKRMIDGGAVKVNDAAVEGYDKVITADDLVDGAVKVSKSRKVHHFIKVG